MATCNEFLNRNARATRFGNLDLVPSAHPLASRLLPNSPLRRPDKSVAVFGNDRWRMDANAHRGDRRVSSFARISTDCISRTRVGAALDLWAHPLYDGVHYGQRRRRQMKQHEVTVPQIGLIAGTR